MTEEHNGDVEAPTPRSPESEAAPTDTLGVIESRLDAIEALQSAIAERQAHGFATISSDHRETRHKLGDIEAQVLVLTASGEDARMHRRNLEDGQAAIGRSIDLVSAANAAGLAAATSSVDRLGTEMATIAGHVAELRKRDSERAREVDAMEARVDETGRHHVAAILARAEKFDALADAGLRSQMVDSAERNKQIRQVAGTAILAILAAVLGYIFRGG